MYNIYYKTLFVRIDTNLGITKDFIINSTYHIKGDIVESLTTTVTGLDCEYQGTKFTRTGSYEFYKKIGRRCKETFSLEKVDKRDIQKLTFCLGIDLIRDAFFRSTFKYDCMIGIRLLNVVDFVEDSGDSIEEFDEEELKEMGVIE